MTTPIDDRLIQQVFETLFALFIGVGVLTCVYHFGLWIARSIRRRWLDQRSDPHQIHSA